MHMLKNIGALFFIQYLYLNYCCLYSDFVSSLWHARRNDFVFRSPSYFNSPSNGMSLESIYLRNLEATIRSEEQSEQNTFLSV